MKKATTTDLMTRGGVRQRLRWHVEVVKLAPASDDDAADGEAPAASESDDPLGTTAARTHRARVPETRASRTAQS